MTSQIDAAVNYAQAFLDCVAPGESFTFQTFHDREERPAEARVFHGTLQQHGAALMALQQQGHGVFFTVNRTNLQGRQLQDVTHVRALWLDMDDPAVDIAPIMAAMAPHAVVESSPGKHHLYWRLSDCSVESFPTWLDALVAQWHGDNGAKGINRVMRLPGFSHLKGVPFTSRVVAWNPGMDAYTLAHVQHYLLKGQHPASLAAAHAGPPVDWTDVEVDGWRDRLSDETLLQRLTDPDARMTAAEAFGSTRKLYELWNPNMHEIEAAKTRSEDRMSLISRLMVLCGGNCERVYQLCTVPRPHELAVKDNRLDLLRDEITAALRLFLGWWRPKHERRTAQIAEARAIGAEMAEPLTPVVLSLDQMLDEFVLVSEGPFVLWRRNKGAYRKVEATDYWAASRTTVPSGDSEKLVPTLGLWFTEPTRRLSVGSVSWRPGHAEFCEPVSAGRTQQTAYNTWRGFRAVTVPENWREWSAWFEHHVAYLVPIEAERRTFLQWLAHMVQRPGELPHTAYLLVTEQTGTGRNWLAGVLARVLRGYVASGVDIVKILDGKYNGVLSQKLLATVDEVREGADSQGRHQRAETLKSTVTAEERQIEHKYGMQLTEQNCCRWLFFSNHFDALPFDNNDRRIVVVANPTERREPDYYASLYSLHSQPAFIASVFEFLRTLPLEGFEAGRPAPMSETKKRALASLSNAIDRAVSQFLTEWPTAFATERDLRTYVQSVTNETPKNSAMAYAKRRANITTLDGRTTIANLKESIIQLRPSPALTHEQVVAAILAGRAAVA